MQNLNMFPLALFKDGLCCTQAVPITHCLEYKCYQCMSACKCACLYTFVYVRTHLCVSVCECSCMSMCAWMSICTRSARSYKRVQGHMNSCMPSQLALRSSQLIIGPLNWLSGQPRGVVACLFFCFFGDF